MQQENARSLYQNILGHMNSNLIARFQTRNQSALLHQESECPDTSYEDLVTFTGVIAKGKSTAFSVAGRDICLSENTWILGDMKIGAKAKITGLQATDRAIRVTKIFVRR